MSGRTYRGWTVYPDTTGLGPGWNAYSPDYDASWEGPEDGWVASGHSLQARTRAEIEREIDALIEEATE